MKKTKFTLLNTAILVLLIFGFVSCEREFTNIGSDIIAENNFETSSEMFTVITYNRPIGAMQTDGFSDNLLGIFNDPAFGSFTANVVSQIAPNQDTYNPDFGENVVLDSVVLTIPYFNNLIETDEDGNNTYTLDSVFGDSPIKLSIYKSNYFLRDFIPDSEINDQLKYFSDYTLSDGTSIDEASTLQGELIYENDDFLPSEEQIILEELDEENEVFESAKLAPSIRVHLFDPDDPSDTFWQENILDKEGEPELSNQNNFEDHFRGIYFKTEAMGPDGTMMLLNLASTNANITLYYTSELPDDPDSSDTEVATQEGTFVLNFSGTRVNFFNNNYTTIPDGDPINGDEKLFLKGAQGNMAIINLFNGDDEGNSLELEEFRAKNWLINEARLVFYVDQDMVDGEEPERIFIYDVENSNVLLDYLLDSSGGNLPEVAKLDHLPALVREGDEQDGAGIKYKIEITEHINNIFMRDSTNVKLGVAVTSSSTAVENVSLQDENGLVQDIIAGTALSPRGTVLFGNNTANEAKKIQLEIFYTEPDNN
jgi:hypothetical protein